MLIEEGRLIESPCPHCGHLERRAFGESVSDRDELASYAIGWTSGHEEAAGRMTVGLGAGNPGGGTFHIDIRLVDGEPGRPSSTSRSRTCRREAPTSRALRRSPTRISTTSGASPTT